MADTDQLSSMPLSQLAMDDSNPPVVHYGMHVSTATSSPIPTEAGTHGPQQEDSYQQILPGIPQGSLYPTLASLSFEETNPPEESRTLHDKVSKGLENIYKMPSNVEPQKLITLTIMIHVSEGPNTGEAEQLSQLFKGIQIPPAQMPNMDTRVVENTPESLKADTSHATRQECTAVHEQQEQTMITEDIDSEINAQHHDGTHTAEDTMEETTKAQSQLPHVSSTSVDKINMPIKKVGCKLVTSHLKQFLKDYPQSLDKQAFPDIYNMLSLLDKYLYDNPKHHTRCMSSDNEYVILLRYAIHLNIDLSMFPTLWAVLSILLETQDTKHEYVKCLQVEYDTYYAEKPKDYMLKLERQSVELQNHMYDNVTHNFERISGLHDNGLTPSPRHEGDQPTEATTPENAIDDNAIDIRTMYPPWSSDTNDMNDIDQMTHYQSMQDIRHKICKDMPLKTDINKPYIDNIEAYDRDRHLLMVSLKVRPRSE